MKSADELPALERTGYAHVLKEQSESRPEFRRDSGLRSIEIDIPDSIALSKPLTPGIWQFLYMSDESNYDWLDNALGKTTKLSAGTDKAYADLALRQAIHVCEIEPRVYNAPEGGIVIENRTDSGILTLLIEGQIGLIVRSADEFQVKGDFNITPDSVNELLARYVYELRLLFLPEES